MNENDAYLQIISLSSIEKPALLLYNEAKSGGGESVRCFCFDLSKTFKVSYFGEERFSPLRSNLTRIPQELILYFVSEGSLTVEEGSETVVLKAGDVHIFRPFVLQRPVSANKCRYFYVHIDLDSVRMVDKTAAELENEIISTRNAFLTGSLYETQLYSHSYLTLPSDWHFSNAHEFEKIRNLFTSSLKSSTAAKNEYFNQVVSLRFAEILIETYRSFAESGRYGNSRNSKSATAAERLLDHIKANYSSDITRSQIERISGYSFDYINRVFGSRIGMPIFEYITHLRMDEARRLLTTSNMRVGEVAQAVGIHDVYYFSKLFKKSSGVPPSKYTGKADHL